MIRRLAVVGLLAACGRQPAPAPVPVPAPVPEMLKFDWSPPCSVRVTDRVGRRSPRVTSYRIDVRQRRDEVEISLRAPVHLEELGQSVTRDVTFGRTGIGASYLPTIIVSTTGRLLRMHPPLQLHAPPLRPGEEAQLDAIMATFWKLWFGAWIDWPIPPGTTENGFAHLRKSKHVDELGDGAIEAVIEIATMRPRWVIEESADGQRRELSFDWDHAVGCGRDDQGAGAAAGAIPT